MFLQKKKRGPYTNVDQKLWILKDSDETRKISLAKLALDFSNQFNHPISISAISRIIVNKDHLLASMNSAPEIDTERVKKMVSINRAQFESDLEKLLKKNT